MTDLPAPQGVRRPAQSAGGTDGRTSLLSDDGNVWRRARADRVGLIVDGASYFAHLRRALMTAQRQVLLIGWDFDFEIDMLPGDSDAEGLAPDGMPNALGAFLEAVTEAAEGLNLYLLKWNGAPLVAPGRYLPSVAMRVWSNERIHFALDGHHPFGACHHQKIVVVDDVLAFCGGIDVTEDRWDTSDHTPDDPRRKRKSGEPSLPWHDATTALDGPIAATLGELARMRWARARNETLDPPESDLDKVWPDGLESALDGVEVAVARTEPPFGDEPQVDEIERLSLAAVAAARDTLYIESQYFACQTVADAIEARLREPDGPEIVVINPQAAQNVVEDAAMHVLRGRLVERLGEVDAGDRFRIWHPVNAAGEPIYVHAKVMIVDDRLLKIGSSNLNDRSMGFDTECDVAIEGGDAETRAAIVAFRDRLVGEHLDAEPATVSAEVARRGGLVAAMEALNRPSGRGLRQIEAMPEGLLGGLLADSRAFDPRFWRGEGRRTGRGLRPRHLVGAAALVGAALALHWWWRRRR